MKEFLREVLGPFLPWVPLFIIAGAHLYFYGPLTIPVRIVQP